MSTYQPITYIADDSQSDFSITFPYTRPSDINIKVNGETQEIGVNFNVAGSVASFTAPLNSGDEVVISRNTNIGNTSSIPLMQEGGVITADELNKVINNVAYAAQEISQTQGDALLKSNNLSDVSSVVNARLNLSVHDKQTSDEYYDTLINKNYNLSDLISIPTARTNLDVYSKSEVTGLIASSIAGVSLPSNGRVLLDNYSGAALRDFSLYLDRYNNKKINLVPTDGHLFSVNNKLYLFNGASLVTSSLSNSTLYHAYLSVDEDGGYYITLVSAGSNPLTDVPTHIPGNEDSLLIGGVYTSSDYASNGIISVGSIFNGYVHGRSFNGAHTYSDDDYIIGCGNSHINVIAYIYIAAHTMPGDANFPFGGVQYKRYIPEEGPTHLSGPDTINFGVNVKANGSPTIDSDSIWTGFPSLCMLPLYKRITSTWHCSLYRIASQEITNEYIDSDFCYEQYANFNIPITGLGYRLYSLSRSIKASAINSTPHE